MKRSRKKSVEATRLLRELYAEDPNPCPAKLEAWCDLVRERCPDRLDARDLAVHFSEKRTRERAKRAKREAGRQPKTKTPLEQQQLAIAWRQTCGACPARSSRVVHELTSSTSLTYEDIAQWYGQRRFKMKHAARALDRATRLEGYFWDEPAIRVP